MKYKNKTEKNSYIIWNKNIIGKPYLEISKYSVPHEPKKSQWKLENILSWMIMKIQNIKICVMYIKWMWGKYKSYKCVY